MKTGKYFRTLFIFGAAANLVGSVLPWRREGDFISYLTYGILLFPSFKDNGGLIVIILSALVLIFVFRPIRFISKLLIWNLIISFSLVLIASANVLRILTDRANSQGVIGAPIIDIGLIMISLGSLILFISSLVDYLSNQRERTV